MRGRRACATATLRSNSCARTHQDTHRNRDAACGGDEGELVNDENWSGLGLELTRLDWLVHIQKRINSKPGPALTSGDAEI